MKNVMKAVAALMLITTVVCATGCKKTDAPSDEGGETPISTNTINGSISRDLIGDISGLFVETMYDKVALNGENFAVEVADCNIPQFIAVTDAETNIYMLYRGWVSDGNSIVIDDSSTALALVTMHPVLGPIVDPEEHSQLMDIIENNSHFIELRQSVASAIAAHRPVSDTTNMEVMDALYGFFEELTELAGLDSINNGRGDVSDYLGSYPMRVITEDNTVTMRVTVLSPSYYGTVTDENGHSENIRVLTRADYGFMDAFTHTYENMDWADPTNYTIRNSGNYSFEFSKNNPEGLMDFYLHLANNIAGLLGLDMDNDQLNQLSESIATALQLHQGDYGVDAMELVGDVCQGVIDYLASPQNNGRWRNWQLAGRLLNRLNVIYNAVKESCNGLLRVAYYLQAPNDINFCLEYYTNSGINPCSETTITIVGGNNQIGFPHKTLPEPLEVYVTSQTDNGWYIHPEYVVRFAVVSGDGELVQEDVEVDENHKASTSWTLGEQGDDQEVSAVVVDPDSEKELSNKVYFTATFNEGFVTTLPVTNVTETTAVGGGIVTEDALTYVTRCGVCWNTTGVPTIDDSQVFTGPGMGTFHCNISYLTPNTTYHVRAFVSFGVENEYYYGDEVTFDTEGDDDWVDLGLPSGLLWATRNVGASSPEDYGGYFAWAETQPKSVYNWSTYQYCCHNSVYSLTKYCSSSSYGCNGYTDHLTVLEPGDDAATVNWGNGARTPTYNEWMELNNNCSWVWTTQNGIKGMRCTGPNGNTLFLPAAGYRYNSTIIDVGSSGYYWTSSFYAPAGAYGIYFGSRGISIREGGHRDSGPSIRAVRSRSQK